MDKQAYKKAALEHGDFQNPMQAIQHHVELAMAHAFLFMDGSEPDRIIHILNMALVQVISPKVMVPEVIEAPEKPLVIDLFSNVPEPFSIPEENVIAEEHVSNVKTVIVGDTKKIVFPDREVALATLIQNSMLSSRAKIILSRTPLLTLGDVMKYNNKEISLFAGVGFNTLAEIIGRLKTYYGLHLTIFEKGPTLQEQKNTKKAANKKKPSSDDFGRISV
jgi:hypothetical protein